MSMKALERQLGTSRKEQEKALSWIEKKMK
jgi:hypothetical protein